MNDLVAKVDWVAGPREIGDLLPSGPLVLAWAAWTGSPHYPRLPARGTIDIESFVAGWPTMVETEIEPSGRVRYKALGSDVARALGQDITGRYLDEIASGSRFTVLQALYDLTVRSRAAVYSVAAVSARDADGVHSLHRLMLPLTDDGMRVDGVLGIQQVASDGAGEATFSLGMHNRIEWQCRAWVDAHQASAALSARPAVF